MLHDLREVNKLMVIDTPIVPNSHPLVNQIPPSSEWNYPMHSLLSHFMLIEKNVWPYTWGQAVLLDNSATRGSYLSFSFLKSPTDRRISEETGSGIRGACQGFLSPWSWLWVNNYSVLRVLSQWEMLSQCDSSTGPFPQLGTRKLCPGNAKTNARESDFSTESEPMGLPNRAGEKEGWHVAILCWLQTSHCMRCLSSSPDDSLAVLGHARYFSMLALASEYWQGPMCYHFNTGYFVF